MSKSEPEHSQCVLQCRNIAPCKAIDGTVNDKRVPNYSKALIRSYLSERIRVASCDGYMEMIVYCGIPQGSVLG